MMEEAVGVMRLLWSGGTQSHRGRYFTVDNARVYTLPEEPPPIYVATGGKRSARVAGRIGDGLIATAPRKESLEEFQRAGGEGKPRYGGLAVCWAQDEVSARRTAREWWPNAALKGELSQELSLPAHYEQATEDVSEEQVASEVVCGPDSDRHIQKIREYIDAGFDHVYVHQVGPEQDGFFSFYEREVLPVLRNATPVGSASG